MFTYMAVLHPGQQLRDTSPVRNTSAVEVQTNTDSKHCGAIYEHSGRFLITYHESGGCSYTDEMGADFITQ